MLCIMQAHPGPHGWEGLLKPYDSYALLRA